MLLPDASPSFAQRARWAAACVAVAAAAWVLIALVPWDSAWALLLGLAVWMAWVPALATVTIAACLLCMITKGVFRPLGTQAVDPSLTPFECQISTVSMASGVAALVLAMAGTGVKDHVGRGTNYLFHTRNLPASEGRVERAYVDAPNVCATRVRKMLKNQNDYPALAVVIRVNGQDPARASGACKLPVNRVSVSWLPASDGRP